MRQSGVIAAVAKKAKMTQGEAEDAIKALCEVIEETVLVEKDEISLPIGKFKVKINKAKKGVNPLTKKPLDVPESHTIAFKPSKTVKRIIG